MSSTRQKGRFLKGTLPPQSALMSKIYLLVVFTFCASAVNAANYDEAKVGSYTLPDPLVCADGSRVTNAETWFAKRRPEILELYRENIFGRSPVAGTNIAFNVWESSTNALDGKATRKQIEINYSGTMDGPLAHLLLYTPAGKTNCPTFLCLSFGGNYTAIDDPAIAIFSRVELENASVRDAEKSQARFVRAQLEKSPMPSRDVTASPSYATGN